MGTAASVPPGKDGFHELPDQNGQNRISTRSSNLHSTRGGNRSVRAMALMNHSRQENSYMNADEISTHLLARSSRRAESGEIEFPKQFTEKGESAPKVPVFRPGPNFHRRQSHEPTLSSVPSISNMATSSSKTRLVDMSSSVELLGERSTSTLMNTTTPSPKNADNNDSNKQEQLKEQADESMSVGGSNLPSLKIFRSGLNLKLDVDESQATDPDWNGRIEEADDEKCVNDIPEIAPKLVTLKPSFGLSINIAHSDEPVNSPKVDLDQGTAEQSEVQQPSNPLADKAAPVFGGRPTMTINTDMQMQNGALFVDGMEMGVGAGGIIRPNQEQLPHAKLPMRERLIILCKLGSGASSAVYKALDLVEMRLVALKTIQVYEREKRVQMVRELTALFQLLRENSRRESFHLKKNQRPEKYIVDFYDAFSNMEDGLVCLMIEYMDGGSLQDIVDQGGCDDESTLANIAVQALKGLSFLHNNNQIHRDLKPGNFLISHRGEVKVADLGILKQLPPPAPGVLQRTNSFVGTATYMSPERIDGKDYSFPSDVWAFGLSLATIALGNLPIDTKGGYWTILKSIRDAPPPQLPETFSPQFRDFVAQCLKKNPDDRASCKQLLKHSFLNMVVQEDMSYQQSYDRGRNELLEIIQAMAMHIEQLKKDALASYSEADNALNLTPRLDEPVSSKAALNYSQHISAAHEKLFGNLLQLSTVQILRRILFDEREGSSNRLAKPRLTTLARQLHLPLDRVHAEVRAFVDNMAKESQASILTTAETDMASSDPSILAEQ